MTVSPHNQTAVPNLEAEPFMTSHQIVASGAGAAPVALANPEGSAVSKAAARPSEQEEETLWEGRYSFKNFLGRTIAGAALVLAWIGMSIYTWGHGVSGLGFATYLLGAAAVLYGMVVGVKFFRAQRTHFYKLTTRRLFLTTGFLHKRVDQVELVRVKDLFVRQSLIGTWLNVGTVVLISSEPTLPKAHLLGIEAPRHVLDLIWRHTREERDRRTTEVDSV